MSIHFSQVGTGNSSLEGPTTMEMFLPSVGAGAVVYGGDEDEKKRYVSFLKSEAENYPAQPWFFWNQPLDDSGWVAAHSGSGGASVTTTTASLSLSLLSPMSRAPTASATDQDKGTGTAGGKSGGERILLGTFGHLFLGAVTLVSSHALLFT